MPLYHQIFLQLRDEILSGERPYGSTLPTEQELSALYGVSRITARRVLNELAQQHFVERKRRLGTRVTFQSPAKPIEADIDQAVDSLLALGHGTVVNVIDVALEPASPTVAGMLHLEPGAEVLRAVRVRCLDGEPLGYVVSYVPAKLADAVTQTTLVKGPILRLLDEAGYHAEHADQTIAATLADPQLAEALGVEPRSALLKISRTVYDRDDVPFLVTFAHYRSDRFHIRLDLHHPGMTVAR
ncbi:GntR family transcriptional regulator [Novosphingobium piscinae]|uniref:GntR family transcriptional regulator n=2 Tax=Novosphingobium piscinae TaxID=1507448 RepID=A0A7X1FZH2_9SPHN|nr:GntR family transcriptional regulator [Novosphingobium piscinae]